MKPLSQLVGQSPGITAIRETIGRLLQRHSETRRLPPILIQGETGTGKGLVAHALHGEGPRASGPFVDVNCAAIPGTLLESEMFGYERGAFTDARQAKRGLFQAAHHGTIFLDEVGLLPEALQSKLLKVIEEREVRRLGSTRSEPVDAWILTATSENLLTATRERRFREDLYHRLAVLTLWLPPLRERGRDILLLADHYLARACADYELPPKHLTEDARAALMAYPWPGNIRELANVMERVALLSEVAEVTADTLGLPAPPAAGPRGLEGAAAARPLGEVVGSVERERLLEVLHQTDWNISRAAARLQMPRNTLRYRIEKHGLRRADAAPPSGRTEPVRAVSPPAPAPMLAAAATPAAPLPATPIVRWERRRLTLLRAVLRPETRVSELPNGTSRALEVLVEKLASFGGRVEELSPTGLMAVFGLDPAEDAPSRAALAALAILKAASRGQPGGGQAFTVTLAIHVEQFMLARVSGTATLDEEARREAGAVLDELAERAGPDAILISGAAAAFFDRRFELVPAPAAGPGARLAYRLGRFERTGLRLGGRLATFVGRHHDLQLLRSRLESVMRGQGQVVGIAGDAGIGKSRLLFEFRQSLAGQPVNYLEGYCFSYGSTVPYLPVLDMVRASFGISDADTPDTIAEKATDGLQAAGLAAAATPYLLQLLGLKEGTDRLAAVRPEEIKARTFEVLREMSVRQSRQTPLIIAVEDLHWIDTTSEEYFASLADVIATARILVVSTYRPGYRPRWIDKSYAAQMALQPLAPADSLAVVRSILGASEPADALMDLILAKAEGNPFFLEELARTVREQGRRAAALAVPDTIEEVILSRMDRLPPAHRSLLQEASVIGKDVPFVLLQAGTELSDDELRRGLTALKAGEFLYETSVGAEPEYTFKHALTHEVAYASLLAERRRELHARVVEVIERLYPDRLSEHIERLAHHAFAAGVWDKALLFLRQAGAKAYARASHREAVASFEQALTALKHLPEGRDTIERAIDLRFDLRVSLLPLGELTRGLDYLREAEALATTLDEPQRLGWLAVYMAGQFYLMGDQDAAFTAGQRALSIADQLGDFRLLVSANTYVGQIYHARGEYGRAAAFFRKNVASLVGELVHERFGLPQLPSVHSRTCLAWSLAELGEFGEGIAQGAEALRIAESVDQPLSLTVALSGLGTLHLRQGDLQRSIPVLERGLELSRVSNIPLWFPRLASDLGSAYARSGRQPDGFRLLEQAVERARGMNLVSGHSLLLSALAEGQLLAGRLGEALRLARRALEFAERHQERGYAAEVLHLLGEIALESTPADPEPAAEYYRRALAVAEELGMRPLVGQSHLGLGRACQRAGDRPGAENHLAAATALFREMGMVAWVARAEAELARLG